MKDTTRKSVDTNVRIGYYVAAEPDGSIESLKVYVPDIMDFKKEVAKENPDTVNPSIYINSKDCIPAVSKKINLQNFITINPPPIPYEHEKIAFDAKMTFVYDDEIYSSASATNNIDPTFTEAEEEEEEETPTFLDELMKSMEEQGEDLKKILQEFLSDEEEGGE